jgi:isopentenyl-diphosphate delta-isomerase
MPKILLVDEQYQAAGLEEKLIVHELGLRHFSFSIFIFNSHKELLVQKRALNKYHSGGLWSNSCCGHLEKEELTITAASCRLKEELGFICELKEIFTFPYHVKLENNLRENEIDHVFVGVFNRRPKPDSLEVVNYKYISLKNLQKDLKTNPSNYTAWLKIIVNKYYGKLESFLPDF